MEKILSSLLATYLTACGIGEVGAPDFENQPQQPASACSEHCTNGAQDCGESGIDCGGECSHCIDPCQAHCSNGAQDCDETGIDCGGECAACIDPCEGHCSNGAQDCDETGIDCGGDCAACIDPCQGHCSNSAQDCGESGIDCGGECAACVDPCEGHCSNGALDCGESGLDCGGACMACEPQTGCTFPQGVPDGDYFHGSETNPAIGADVNQVMATLSGCSIGSSCVISGSFPSAQSWFDAVNAQLRSQEYCAGQHILGHTDEIAVSDTGCTGRWYGYHIFNYGGSKVVWSPGAQRGWWGIQPQWCE